MPWALEAAWTDKDIEGLTGTPTLSGIEKPKAGMGLFRKGPFLDPGLPACCPERVFPCTQGQV